MQLPADLTLHTFRPHQGTTFLLQAPGGAVPLELVRVQPLGHGMPGRREPFSLLFLGPDARHVEQRTWPLEHAVLGRLDVFLVPLGPSEGRMRYEAVFS
jgi:hypothetical protein